MILYIVILIIVIVIVVLVTYKKPTYTPTVTTMIYSAKVLEYYNELILKKYSEIQMGITMLTGFVNAIKSDSSASHESNQFFPDLGKYKLQYLQLLELSIKTASIIQDRPPTSEEKSMILNNINQIVIIMEKIPRLSGMKMEKSIVTLPAFTLDPMELEKQHKQIEEKIVKLLIQPMTPLQSERVKQKKLQFNQELEANKNNVDELTKLQILIVNKIELYAQLQSVL